MKKLVYYLAKIEAFYSVVVFMIVFCVMVWQVLARVVFNVPNAWSEELTRFLCFSVVFFGASIAIDEETHIRIDGLLSLYPEKSRIFIALLGYAVMFLYTLFVIYFGWRFTMGSWKMGTIAPSLGGIKMWVFYISLPISHFCMAIHIVDVMIRIIKRKSWQIVAA